MIFNDVRIATSAIWWIILRCEWLEKFSVDVGGIFWFHGLGVVGVFADVAMAERLRLITTITHNNVGIPTRSITTVSCEFLVICSVFINLGVFIHAEYLSRVEIK